MITCRELAELLLEFVANELPDEHRAMVEQHLCDCPPCYTYVETYQITIKLSRKLPCRPMPDTLMERLQEAMETIQREMEQE